MRRKAQIYREEVSDKCGQNSISMARKSEYVKLAKEFMKSVNSELQTRKRGKSQVLYLEKKLKMGKKTPQGDISIS